MTKILQKKIIFITSFLLLANLLACSNLYDEAVILEGERIPIFVYNDTLKLYEDIDDKPVILPPPYKNDDWPQPGGYASQAMYHLSISENIEQRWSESIGKSGNKIAKILSTPIIYKDIIYALDASSNITALNAVTGDLLWRKKIKPSAQQDFEGRGGGISSEDGIVIVANGYGMVAAFNGDDGQNLWSKNFNIPFRVAPTIWGGRVFIISQSNRLYCLHIADGSILWTYQASSADAEMMSNTSPAASGNTVIAPFSSGELVALDINTGRLKWADTLYRSKRVRGLDMLTSISSRPVIDRDAVFSIGHSGRLVSIDLSTGERIWSKNIEGTQTPWLAGNFLFVVTTDSDLVCLDRNTGKTIWITRLQKYANQKKMEDIIIWNGPILVGDRLILTSSNGYILSVSPYSGNVIGKKIIKSRILISPIVAKETLYILTERGKIISFN